MGAQKRVGPEYHAWVIYMGKHTHASWHILSKNPPIIFTRIYIGGIISGIHRLPKYNNRNIPDFLQDIIKGVHKDVLVHHYHGI